MQPVDVLEGDDASNGPKRLVLLQTETLAQATAFVRTMPTDQPGFALMTAGDASSATVDEMAALADASLSRGMFWFSAWGPDCERVHDVVDEIKVSRGLDDRDGGGPLVTTWYDEPILQALQFFWHSAQPPDDLPAGPLRLLISIAQPQVSAAVLQLSGSSFPDQ